MRDDQSLWGMTEILRGHDLADATLRICGLGDASDEARVLTVPAEPPSASSALRVSPAIAKEKGE
jgi:hypothetical protein